ncbi:pyrroline-5-carboxylate reductase [Oleiharenicola lentus]|uniref:Pyrroline-5-carboxylate reductase n=1 Tax=Oleiharenicola lentus TaxID=2508720 RepID=A0A4Q1C9S3_9BACT|nr:pyrroline-5-carboxylate reductase [Oleiharenicola lentus]RXK55783.1 pyrroline-5-carboxylate reductase [Oleiharenicola lentus]
MAKLAFLGAGNLASAIIRGLLAHQVCVPEDIACTSKGGETAARLAASTGIAHQPDLAQLLGPADVVIVAFKPQSLAAADPRLAELTRGKLVLSVLAGKKLSTLSRTFPLARNLVRTMPNTPAAIGAGITPFCSLHPLSPDDSALVIRILEALGVCLPLDEQYFDALTAVGGSGPAFLFEFVAGLRDAALAAGLPSDVAPRMALETVLGAARLLARTGETPEALRDKVTSPNGTTYAGLQVLARREFRETLKETVAAATRRAGELSQD